MYHLCTSEIRNFGAGAEDAGEGMAVGAGTRTAHLGEERENAGKIMAPGVDSNDGIPEADGPVGSLVEEETGGEDVVVGCVGAEEFGGERRVGREAGGDENGVELLGLGKGRTHSQGVEDFRKESSSHSRSLAPAATAFSLFTCVTAGFEIRK